MQFFRLPTKDLWELKLADSNKIIVLESPLDLSPTLYVQIRRGGRPIDKRAPTIDEIKLMFERLKKTDDERGLPAFCQVVIPILEERRRCVGSGEAVTTNLLDRLRQTQLREDRKSSSRNKEIM